MITKQFTEVPWYQCLVDGIIQRCDLGVIGSPIAVEGELQNIKKKTWAEDEQALGVKLIWEHLNSKSLF